jgi:hypothetical protein
MMPGLGGAEEYALTDEAESTLGFEHQYEKGSFGEIMLSSSIDVARFDRPEVVGTCRSEQATVTE